MKRLLLFLASLPLLAQPTVTSVVVSAVSHSVARVQATSSLSIANASPSGERVRFGTTTAYEASPLGGILAQGMQQCDHDAVQCPGVYQIYGTLSGLAPSTLYHVQMQASTDGVTWGSSGDSTFTTAALPATHPALPIAPETFDTSYPNTGAYSTVTASSCSDLNTKLATAVNARGSGWVILLAPGAFDTTSTTCIQPPVDPSAMSFTPANVVAGVTNTITVTGTITANEPFRFAADPTSGACLPGFGVSCFITGPFLYGTVYYAVNPVPSGGNTAFQVSYTSGGSAVPLVNTGSGTSYVVPIPAPGGPEIIIRTSTADSAFCLAGMRCRGVDWASKMATVKVTGGTFQSVGEFGPLVYASNVGAHDIRILGLEITQTDVSSLAATSTDPKPTYALIDSEFQFAATRIFFDRDYIHGLPAPNRVYRPVADFDGKYMAIINSDLSEWSYWRPWLDAGTGNGPNAFAQSISGNQVSTANGSTYYAGPFFSASGFCTSNNYSSTVTAGSSAAVTVSSATNANPGVLTAAGIHGVISGNQYGANISGFTGSWTALNGTSASNGLIVIFTGASTFTVQFGAGGTPINTTSFGAIAGSPVVTVITTAVIYFTANCTPTTVYPVGLTVTAAGTGSDGTNTRTGAAVNTGAGTDPTFPGDGNGSSWGGSAEIATITLWNGVAHATAVFGPSASSYATEGTNGLIAGVGPGPWQMYNNYIDAPGLAWHFDDGGAGIATPLGYVIQRNTFVLSAKYHTGAAGSDNLDYEERNPLEWKNGSQCLIDGNTWTNFWSGVSSLGSALTFTPRGLATTTDCEIKNNTSTNGAYFLTAIGGFATGGQVAPNPLLRFYAHNNVNNQPNGWTQFSPANRFNSSGPYTLYFGDAMEDFIFDHNTSYNPLGTDPAFAHSIGQPEEGFEIKNNILFCSNDNGAYCLDSEGITTNTPNCGSGLAIAWTGPCFIQGTGVPFWNTGGDVIVPYYISTNPPTGVMPASTTCTNWGGSGFMAPTTCSAFMSGSNMGLNYLEGDTTTAARLAGVDFTNPSTGVFSLAAGSNWKGMATDSTDPGVDYSQLQNSQGVVRSITVSSITATSAVITTITPDSQGCPIDWGPAGFATASFTARVSQAGGSTTQVTAVAGLPANTAIDAQAMCAVHQPRVSFSTSSGSTPGIPVAGPGVAGPGVQ